MRLGFDLAVIVAAIAGAVVWIEHGHRIDIDTPAGAAFVALADAVCPDNENVPYGTDCITFMQGSAPAGDMHLRVPATKGAPATASEAVGPACPPNNENKPYSANCIRFMSGWFWRPNIP